MKALLYKEFKLAMHPICYVFICLFPFMVFIPNYPVAVGFIYVLSCYPVLFLGANKGQQSNDLLFSTLLPVRKKDIVLARILTVSIMQIAFILIMSALVPLSMLFQEKLHALSAEVETPGLPLQGFISIIGIALVGFSLADLIFFPIYYKKGKSIVASTLLTIFAFALYLTLTTIVLPFLPGFEGYTYFLAGSGVGNQLIVLGASILVYLAAHFLVYRISAKRLDRVDF